MRLPKRFRSNALTGYMRGGVAAVIGLVVTPVLVIGLGTEAYGIWVVVGSFAIYRQLLQLGFAAATPKYVAEAAAANDDRRLRTTIATSFWLLALPGLLALIIGLGIAAAFPSLFGVPDELRTASQIFVVLVVIDLALAIPGDAFGGTLMGLQRFDLMNWSLLAVSTAQAIGWVVVMLLDGGLVALGVVTLAFSLCGQLSRYLLARRLVPGLSVRPTWFDRSIVRPLAGLSVWIAIEDAAYILINRVDVVVVGLVVGLEGAAIYGVGQRLVGVLGQLVYPLENLFLPHSSELAARRDQQALRESLVAGTRLVLAIVLPVALTLAALASGILDAWVGSGFEPAAWVVALLAAAIAITSISDTGLVMIQGVGRARRPAIIRAGEVAINLGLSIALAHAIGLEGVALATLVAAVTMNLLVLYPYLCREFGIGPFRFLASLLGAHGPPLLVASLLAWGAAGLDPSGWLELAAAGTLIAGSYVAVFWFSGMTRGERRAVARRARGLFGRPRSAGA